MMKQIEVVEARWSHPRNAMAGLYIQLRGAKEAIGGEAGIERAKEIAQEFGFDPEGQAEMGYPTGWGLTVNERCYWFYDVGGRWAPLTPEGKAAIEAATVGPKAIYQYPQEDPRPCNKHLTVRKEG